MSAGLTNEYLVNTGADAAMTYNDRSVNENGHASLGFRLLHRPSNNFLEARIGPCPLPITAVLGLHCVRCSLIVILQAGVRYHLTAVNIGIAAVVPKQHAVKPRKYRALLGLADLGSSHIRSYNVTLCCPQGLPNEQYRFVRSTIVSIVLATDMVGHARLTKAGSLLQPTTHDPSAAA